MKTKEKGPIVHFALENGNCVPGTDVALCVRWKPRTSMRLAVDTSKKGKQILSGKCQIVRNMPLCIRIYMPCIVVRSLNYLVHVANSLGDSGLCIQVRRCFCSQTSVSMQLLVSIRG